MIFVRTISGYIFYLTVDCILINNHFQIPVSLSKIKLKGISRINNNLLTNCQINVIIVYELFEQVKKKKKHHFSSFNTDDTAMTITR